MHLLAATYLLLSELCMTAALTFLKWIHHDEIDI